MLLETLYDALDKYGDKVKIVCGLIKNTFYDYVIRDDTQGSIPIEEVDLIRCGVNQNNEIITYKHIYL